MTRKKPTPRSDDHAVYVISVAAELAGVHPQTLRIYERKGLLRPARTAGNTRRYSERDIEMLRTIQRLTQEEGVNLAGVRMIVEMTRQLARAQAQAEALLRELERAREVAPEEGERYRRGQPPAEIVPLSAARRARLRVDVRTRTASGPSGDAIPLGPAGDGKGDRRR